MSTRTAVDKASISQVVNDLLIFWSPKSARSISCGVYYAINCVLTSFQIVSLLIWPTQVVPINKQVIVILLEIHMQWRPSRIENFYALLRRGSDVTLSNCATENSSIWVTKSVTPVLLWSLRGVYNVFTNNNDYQREWKPSLLNSK